MNLPPLVSPELKTLLSDVSEGFQREMDRMAATLREATESLDRAAASLEPSARAVGSRGWTIPPWAGLRFVGYMAEFSAEELDQMMLEMYSMRDNEQEEQLLSSLLTTPALSRWHLLVGQCCFCYRSEKYAVVVPALLTVIEGAVVSEDSLQTRNKPIPLARGMAQGSDTSMARLAWVSVESFLSVIFGSHAFDADVPQQLNRHWVLHGRAEPSWSRGDCLKLFHALSTIAMVAETYQRA